MRGPPGERQAGRWVGERKAAGFLPDALLLIQNAPSARSRLPGGGHFFVSSDFFFLLSTEQPLRIQVEIPIRGSSHPWRKNHAATTIPSSNKSFIFLPP